MGLIVKIAPLYRDASASCLRVFHLQIIPEPNPAGWRPQRATLSSSQGLWKGCRAVFFLFIVKVKKQRKNKTKNRKLS